MLKRTPFKSKPSKLKTTNGFKPKNKPTETISEHKAATISPNITLVSHASNSSKSNAKDKPTPIQKPTTATKPARIKSQSTINKCKLDHCEWCGATCSGNEPHHIITRGAGGPDIPENLVQLCPICHRKAHAGAIPRDRLFAVVARRLGIKKSVQMDILKAATGRDWTEN